MNLFLQTGDARLAHPTVILMHLHNVAQTAGLSPKTLGALAPTAEHGEINLDDSSNPITWRKVDYGVLLQSHQDWRARLIACIAPLRAQYDINAFAQLPKIPRLALFDMDSTLVEEETLDELAHLWMRDKTAHRDDFIRQISRLTERAMRGQLAFQTSLRVRLRYFVGMPSSLADERLAQGLRYSVGAKRLITALNRMGCATLLVSGGFVPFARVVAETLKLDGFFCNRWQTDECGRLTGGLDGELMSAEHKRDTLIREATRRGLSMAETMCMGDGANDLPMLRHSELSIAWRGKPIVRDQISVQLNHTPMDAVLAWCRKD